MSANFNEKNYAAKMDKTIQSFKKDLSTLRTGRANSSMLDMIKVDVYGQMMPINQLASVSVPEARLITVQVWDQGNVKAVDAAIQKSELGINPQIDGSTLRLRIPDLTEERRKDLIKVLKNIGEKNKVSIRNIRREANDELKKLVKDKKISDNDKKLRFLWSNSKINLNSLNSNTLLTQKEREEIQKFVKTYKNVQQVNAEKAERNRKLKERRKENKIQSEKDKKKARENNQKRGDAMISIKNKTKMGKYLAKTQMCKHGSKCKRKKTCKFAHSEDELVKAICRFGKLCKRSDCYYRHPEGRYIDEKPDANNNLQLKQFMK